MTQAHAFLVPQTQFDSQTEVSEAQLPATLVRHLKALRIRADESVSFLDGAGRISNALCTSSKPYSFRITDIETPAPTLPQVHLFLSPPRRDTLSQTLSQATEMGVAHIHFLVTEHNDYSHKEREPLTERASRVIEAAVEQCRAAHCPRLHPEWKSVAQALENFSGPIFFADEDLSRQSLYGPLTIPTFSAQTPVALLIGPEGGWSSTERSLIAKSPHVLPLGLGPRILKVPTACVAALYQIMILGQGGPR